MTRDLHPHVSIIHPGDRLSTRRAITQALPGGTYERILIKPNWVMHQTSGHFPIKALITDSSLLDDVIQACLDKYPSLTDITVGDVPLQSCDFGLLRQQSGLDPYISKYERHKKPVIRFLDLRKERWMVVDGFMKLVDDLPGDPLGYAVVSLQSTSMLDEVSSNSHRFRVSDYDPIEMDSAHCKGSHNYTIARSVLAADLVINMPKMKTHQKAGITGALKNLVGINGSKACLVHHQVGKPSRGGDEFPEHTDPWIVAQTRVRSLLQKRSRLLFRGLRRGWEVVKQRKGIQTVGTTEQMKGSFYIAAGSWYGNDSIWRMVYDLNMIMLLAPTNGGALRLTPQRDYFCVLDGMTAGEGNGPIQSIPVHTNTVLLGGNSFAVDLVMAKMMGFDYRRIPLLGNYRRFGYTPWVQFEPDGFLISREGVHLNRGVEDVPVIHDFIPPPGWRDHIEIGERGERYA